MIRQKGYTLIEVIVVLWLLLCAAGVVGVVWTACHFIAKFW